MQTVTATSFRKTLFSLLDAAIHSVPVRIRYKKEDAVLMSYRQYLALSQKKGSVSAGGKKRPLVHGKILKPLGEAADAEVMTYMGL